MSEYTQNLQFADPLLQLGVPKLLTSLDTLELYTSGAHYVLDWTPDALMASAPVREWTKFVLRKAMQDATVIVAPVHELDALRRGGTRGQDHHHVDGQRPAHRAIQGQGRPPGDRRLADAVRPRAGPEPPRRDDHRRDGKGRPTTSSRTTTWRSSPTSQLEPRIIYPNGFKRVNRFAFVIHPLSQEYFKNIKPIELLSQVSPPVFMDTLEKAMAYAPPFVYSKVTGIKSPTGVEAEGWLISVGGTPKEIMSHSPEFTYRRLLDAARMAKQPRARRSWASAPSPRWSATRASPWPGARRCRSPRATATARPARCGPRTTPCCAWVSCPRRSAGRR